MGKLTVAPSFRRTPSLENLLQARLLGCIGGNHGAVCEGQDVVQIRVADQQTPRSIVGEVLAYTRQSVRIRTRGGRERSFPTLQTVSVETDWSAPYRRGERAFGRGDYRRASSAYAEALAIAERNWVREWMLARQVWCWQANEQWDRAADAFLALYAAAPETPHFAAIPLAWTGAETVDPDRARAWLETTQAPVAQLLGASHRLGTPDEARAAATLDMLRHDRDPYVAALAAIQQWRVPTATPQVAQLEEWAETLRQQPWEIRGGGYLLLGRGWHRLSRPHRAAEAFLRLPIHHSRHALLASAALVEAGDALLASGDSSGAVRLWREVVEQYAHTYWRREAELRLSQLPRDPSRQPPANDPSRDVPNLGS